MAKHPWATAVISIRESDGRARYLVRLPDGRTKMAAWIEGSHLVRE